MMGKNSYYCPAKYLQRALHQSAATLIHCTFQNNLKNVQEFLQKNFGQDGHGNLNYSYYHIDTFIVPQKTYLLQ